MLHNKFRVLLIEDDAVLRRGLAQIFFREDAEVIQLADGRQAVDLIKKQSHDLIISDLRLPGIDGLEILSKLRSTGQTTPFILVTAYYSEDLAMKATTLGATAVLEKPIMLMQLLKQYEVCLKNHLQALKSN